MKLDHNRTGGNQLRDSSAVTHLMVCRVWEELEWDFPAWVLIPTRKERRSLPAPVRHRVRYGNHSEAWMCGFSCGGHSDLASGSLLKERKGDRGRVQAATGKAERRGGGSVWEKEVWSFLQDQAWAVTRGADVCRGTAVRGSVEARTPALFRSHLCVGSAEGDKVASAPHPRL